MLIGRIREGHVSAQRKRAKDAEDYVALAEDYERENEELGREVKERDERIRERDEQIADLKAQVHELNFSHRWTQDASDAEQEQPDTIPSTVEDAVLQAMDECKRLRFGADVDGGIAGLAADAGPPMKILRYLRALDDMTGRLQTGSLGTTMHRWLHDQGTEVSGESPTIRNSSAQMAKRTWDNGSGTRREFESHLKPSDSTSPDRCARIYFDYDNISCETIVAWVGRHPE